MVLCNKEREIIAVKSSAEEMSRLFHLKNWAQGDLEGQWGEKWNGAPYWEFIKPPLSGIFHKYSEMGRLKGNTGPFIWGRNKEERNAGWDLLWGTSHLHPWADGLESYRSDQLSADTKELILKAYLRSRWKHCASFSMTSLFKLCKCDTNKETEVYSALSQVRQRLLGGVKWSIKGAGLDSVPRSLGSRVRAHCTLHGYLWNTEDCYSKANNRLSEASSRVCLHGCHLPRHGT